MASNRSYLYLNLIPLVAVTQILGKCIPKNALLQPRRYCRLLLHLSHFFVQIDFQTLLLFLHSWVFTYSPLKDGSPAYCPVALGFLHLARCRVFIKDPIEAWESRNFSMRERVGDWPLFCQTDTSTQTLKVRSNLPVHLVGRKQCDSNLSYITTLTFIFKHCL